MIYKKYNFKKLPFSVIFLNHRQPSHVFDFDRSYSKLKHFSILSWRKILKFSAFHLKKLSFWLYNISLKLQIEVFQNEKHYSDKFFIFVNNECFLWIILQLFHLIFTLTSEWFLIVGFLILFSLFYLNFKTIIYFLNFFDFVFPSFVYSDSEKI